MEHVLRDKLTAIAATVEKFSVPYGSREFVTVFARVRHWTLPWVRESTLRSVINLGLLLRPSIFFGLLFKIICNLGSLKTNGRIIVLFTLTSEVLESKEYDFLY